MSVLIKKLEAFRANLVGEDMNYRACLVDEAISRIREMEAWSGRAIFALHEAYNDTPGWCDTYKAVVREYPTPVQTPATYPYPHCRQKAVCAGKGSCPLDPTCGD